MLRQADTTLTFDTRGRGLVEITRPVADFVSKGGMQSGVLTLFLRHTSASLLIQENADPLVRDDLERFSRASCPTATRCSGTTTKVPTTCRRTSARRLPRSSYRFRSPAGASRSAPGRASICGSIGCGRIGAKWPCT